ncbi:hypothetical protein D3C73_1194530 [compost metagenome]
MAGRESEAATSGLTSDMMASGKIMPVVLSRIRLSGCRVRMITSTGTSTSKERATPVGTWGGNLMVMLLRLRKA